MDEQTKLWFELVRENVRLKTALKTLKYLVEKDKKSHKDRCALLNEDELNIVLQLAGISIEEDV